MCRQVASDPQQGPGGARPASASHFSRPACLPRGPSSRGSSLAWLPRPETSVDVIPRAQDPGRAGGEGAGRVWNRKGSTRRAAPRLPKVWKGSAFFRMFQRVAVVRRCTQYTSRLRSHHLSLTPQGGLETGEVQPHTTPEHRAFPTWALTARGQWVQAGFLLQCGRF